MCIFHWFTGTAAERRRAIEAGAWFSINPRMLKTKSGRETIKAIPADRLLLETDAPFVMKIETPRNLVAELEVLETGVNGIRGENLHKQIEKNQELLWS